MALTALTYFPAAITSGDTTRLTLSFPDCPATTFTATLVLNTPGTAPITCAGSANGDAFNFTITAAQSATMAAGRWTWAARCTETASGDVTSGGDGDFTVLANYATTITKSDAQQQLDAANTAFLSLVANPDSTVSFNGHSFSAASKDELLNIIERLRGLVAREQAAAAGLRGDAPTRSIRPYFV